MLQTRNPWGMSIHIPALIILQIIFIILFGLFTRYDPETAYRNQYKNSHGEGSKEHAHQLISNYYPMFQDVHVMIFIGFGFLMTFLKRYGLSAVSLNMLLSAVAIEVFTLVYGFFHLHHTEGGLPFIGIDLGTMLSADFAAAAVLI